MLRELGSDDPRFRTVRFRPGLNLIVADRTATSTPDQSRNAVGKTSVVELLHFLLGADKTGIKLMDDKTISQATFRLDMDWPGQEDPIRIRRSGRSPNEILLNPDITQESHTLFEDEKPVTLKEWRAAIERDLFGIRPEDKGLSGRILLNLYMRREEKGGFKDALKPAERTSAHLVTTHLAYVLGMDWRLARRYVDLSEREATRRKLVAAQKDPVWGKIVGSSAELRGQIRTVQQRVNELEQQINEFKVVPEYEEIQREADEVNRRIRKLRNEEAVHRRNLEELEQAVTDVYEPDDRYLERAYAELNVILGDQVRARFDQVREFHQAVVRNRRHYLQEEITQLRERIRASEQEREELGRRQAELMRILNEGGALDTLTVLQNALGQERARLEALQHRLAAAQALEQSKREIDREKDRLEEEMQIDIEERAEVEQQAHALFSSFVQELYGNDRTPYLAFKARKSSLDIILQLDSDSSSGISNMKTFCFDLTCAIIAHREGRGPDFLVHDSKLYDGVDERQVYRALTLAARLMEDEGMQYVVTINSDDLAKAENLGFDPDPYVIKPRLNDTPSGGLFGFRF